MHWFKLLWPRIKELFQLPEAAGPPLATTSSIPITASMESADAVKIQRNIDRFTMARDTATLGYRREEHERWLAYWEARKAALELHPGA